METPITPEQLREVEVGRYVNAAFLLFAIVLPGLAVVRTIWPRLSLVAFDPLTLPTIVRHLRLRAVARKTWAAILVALIVGFLGIGILVFLSADTLHEMETVAEGGKTTTKLKASDSIVLLIGSLGTRAGAIIILIFLVRILSQMYSNNIRLAAHYESWADAIQLAGTNVEELEKYCRIFDAGKIPLDKPPGSPIKDLADGLKSLESKVDRLKK